jgi:hypothetical protein
MHYLSSVYFVNQPLHVSGIFVAHHQEVYCWLLADQQSVINIPPDDGLQISPKHVEVDWRNKLRINNASSWFWLHIFVWVLICWGGVGSIWCGTGNFLFIIATVRSYITHELLPLERRIRRTFGRTLIQAPADTPKRADLVTRMQSYHKIICGSTWLFSGYTALSHKRLRFLASNTYNGSKGPQIPPPPPKKKSRRHLNNPRQKRDTQHVPYWGPPKNLALSYKIQTHGRPGARDSCAKPIK